ncbi:hypothetical protein LTR62_001108 [Meristemomyces frigidus]|uniref:J domain-containing protein n=1 Tax=Meristemomyces frigidus TaxID=1508187 RepID=A0AAN7T9J7_9PEZI|nr:hypothetical protein LTR62_001108 [Meristemomyces frigidus]
MATPLPADPYLALGVPKDASAAVIKLQYRKLVLKFHPDKVQDESQKQLAADQFHRIQTAWEIVGDEERRKRYDAQCDLALLRKAVLADRQGGSRGGEDMRSTRGTPGTPSGRTTSYGRGGERSHETSPTYEERKPGYAQPAPAGDYFDFAPRPHSRKDADYERPSKRASPRESDRERTKTTKDVKESRARESKERNRKSDREVQKDRDRKHAFVVDEESAESENEYERAARRPREDPAELRRAAENYHDQARRQRNAAQRGAYDADSRARKLYSQYDEARDYMGKARGTLSRGDSERRESERRPSPTRAPSARDSRVEYIKRDGRTPVMVRRGSSRQESAGRDEERRSSAQDTRRKSGDEYDDNARRPPPLSQSKSSPADIRLPNDKPRAHSLQIDPLEKEDLLPKIKRADSMPIQREQERGARRPQPPVHKASTLRQTEFVDGVPTPSATPEYSGGTSPNKYRYHEEYADDYEYATPDGYRTETRKPVGPQTSAPRYTTSPDRMERDRAPRTMSARYDAQPARPTAQPRTTSTSYVYNHGQPVDRPTRPSLSRESSARPDLYGEINGPRDREVRSPRQSQGRYQPPLPEDVRPRKDHAREDVKMQTGYAPSSRRTSEARPFNSRSNSHVYVK